MKFQDFYRKNYKILMIIPLIILVLSTFLVVNKFNNEGELINRDFSLRGGLSLDVNTNVPFGDLENELENKFNIELSIREKTNFGNYQGFVLETGDVEIADDLEELIKSRFGENFNLSKTSGSLGEGFYQDLIKALFIAFFLMAIVVFIAFRNIIPSLAVVLSAFLDIIAPMAIINALGIELSIAGIAAFLLVIGYSVDTDILMTSRVLRGKDNNVVERIFDSGKTGLTMTVTTFIALTVGYFVTGVDLFKEVFLVILIALVIDVISTYLMNAGILMWYMERKNKGIE